MDGCAVHECKEDGPDIALTVVLDLLLLEYNRPPRLCLYVKFAVCSNAGCSHANSMVFVL